MKDFASEELEEEEEEEFLMIGKSALLLLSVVAGMSSALPARTADLPAPEAAPSAVSKSANVAPTTPPLRPANDNSAASLGGTLKRTSTTGATSPDQSAKPLATTSATSGAAEAKSASTTAATTATNEVKTSGAAANAKVTLSPAAPGADSRVPDATKMEAASGIAPSMLHATAAPARATASRLDSEHRFSGKEKTGVLAYVVGSVAEAPAAMCRQSVREFDAGVEDLTNNSSNPILRVPAAIISLPFSIVAGCVEGTIYAIRYHRSNESAPANLQK